jgi:hypothetical protein
VIGDLPIETPFEPVIETVRRHVSLQHMGRSAVKEYNPIQAQRARRRLTAPNDRRSVRYFRFKAAAGQSGEGGTSQQRLAH